MSTVVVCLRSRLLSEAVVKVVSDGGLEAVVADERSVRDAVDDPGAIGVLVDHHTATAIASDGPLGCPAVVLGRRQDDAGGLEEVLAGLPLATDAAELIETLHALAAGELEPSGRSDKSVNRGRRASDALGVLTPREQEVLELIAGAASPSQIAETLDVSEHTVRTHVQNLLAKLGASSKVDAVARARSLGLLDAGRIR